MGKGKREGRMNKEEEEEVEMEGEGGPEIFTHMEEGVATFLLSSTRPLLFQMVQWDLDIWQISTIDLVQKLRTNFN